MAVDATLFLRQSETIETATPELNLTRTAVCTYFTEILAHLEIRRLKDETIFDWDVYGWLDVL